MPPGWHAGASSLVSGVVLMMQYFLDDDIQIYFDPLHLHYSSSSIDIGLAINQRGDGHIFFQTKQNNSMTLGYRRGDEASRLTLTRPHLCNNPPIEVIYLRHGTSRRQCSMRTPFAVAQCMHGNRMLKMKLGDNNGSIFTRQAASR
jgi:hypothetical protein